MANPSSENHPSAGVGVASAMNPPLLLAGNRNPNVRLRLPSPSRINTIAMWCACRCNKAKRHSQTFPGRAGWRWRERSSSEAVAGNRVASACADTSARRRPTARSQKRALKSSEKLITHCCWVLSRALLHGLDSLFTASSSPAFTAPGASSVREDASNS